MMRVPVQEEDEPRAAAIYQKALGRQLSSGSYALVYCADLVSADIAAAYKESLGYALWMDVRALPSMMNHPGNDGTAGYDRHELREIEKRCFQLADKVLVPTRTGARILSAGIDPRCIRLMPRAVDRSIFKPVQAVSGKMGPRTITIVSSNRLELEEAFIPTMLKHLAARLDPEDARFQWLIANPDHEAHVARLLNEHRLSHKVTVEAGLGQVQFSDRLSESYLVVVPAFEPHEKEPWVLPYRGLQAMACGVPPVFVGAEESELFRAHGNEASFVVSSVSPERAATAVIQLLQDEERHQLVRTAGLSYVEHECDLKNSFKVFSGLLTETFGRQIYVHRSEATDLAASSDGETLSRALQSKSQNDVAPLINQQHASHRTEHLGRGANVHEVPANLSQQIPNMRSLQIDHQLTAGGADASGSSSSSYASRTTKMSDKDVQDMWSPDTERDLVPAFRAHENRSEQEKRTFADPQNSSQRKKRKQVFSTGEFRIFELDDLIQPESPSADSSSDDEES